MFERSEKVRLNTMSESFASSDPPYFITVEQRADYLYVCVKLVAVSYESVKGYWLEIAKARNGAESKPVLVEKHEPVQLSIPDAFQVASDLPAIGFAGVHVALVDPNPENQEVNEFTDIVARNRGVPARSFTTVSDAEKWLLSNPGSSFNHPLSS